ncbi:hypothetical protein BO71DRAFT_327675 [Aspergillus ellipticus CBS 707.79]|uniref:Zn(2)-C6 fungal-type domain-containing protein n=1 Tax=Aspergillus ellipticus CBS 707.79 TaxID=1448320 RepID=A0A319D859_9EURO|nr:hypothetical protein BO71DRAFT_327675 [Aspergillus ellipticus CBS 707.79]
MQACNTCRRKKVKCDGKRPACSPCHAFNLQCAYQDGVDRRSRSSRAYVEELEKRVESLQEQLRSDRPRDRLQHSVEVQQGAYSPSRLSRSDAVSSQPSHLDTREHPSKHDELMDQDHSCSTSSGGANDQAYLINVQDGRMRYFGASSAFSALPNTIVSGSGNQTRTEARQRVPRQCATAWQLSNWVPRALQTGLDQCISEPLPSKKETLQLISEFFTSFNQAIPLFDETSFMRLVERQYSWNPDDSASWWISLNIALAIAYRERAHAASDASGNWNKSLGHVKNALNVVVEIFLRYADLSAVQGLLGLALYFQGTPNPQALFIFAAAAMRLAQSMGLHRNNSSGVPSSEEEQRRRTYWIAFQLDADISIRVGRPPIQDSEDFDTSLPAENPHDGKGIITIEGTRINFFRLLVQLSLVQRRVYRHLYTVTARQQPNGKVVQELKLCEEALLEWKSKVPQRLQPHRSFTCDSHYFAQHLLRLHFAYHCCYSNLYQACMFQVNTADASSREELFAIISHTLESARSALALQYQIPLLGSTYKWNVLYFPVAASVPLSLRILAYPGHPHARTDLAMVRETIDFLAAAASEEPGTYADFILSVCSDMEHSARQAIVAEQLSRFQQSVAGEDTSTLGIRADGIGTSTGPADYNMLPVSSGDASMMDMQRTHQISNLSHLSGPDVGLPTLETQSDLMPNWQWSLPPFWNWQDFMTGIPSFPFTPGGQRPEGDIQEN